MINFYRTTEKSKKLRLKRLVKKQIQPILSSIKNIRKLSGVEFHTLCKSKLIGKSRGSSRGSNKKGVFRYLTKSLTGSNYYISCRIDFKSDSFTFNKPQLIGKIITFRKNKYQIIGELY